MAWQRNALQARGQVRCVADHRPLLSGTFADQIAKAIQDVRIEAAKITGKEGLRFSGPARVYDSEEDMLHGLERHEIAKGDVIVIRYEGPKGGPGMPEMLTPTSAIMGAGLGKDVALITDGRFSGGSHGFLVGHITPEAQEGGPIALVRTGDRITIAAGGEHITVLRIISDGTDATVQLAQPLAVVYAGGDKVRFDDTSPGEKTFRITSARMGMPASMPNVMPVIAINKVIQLTETPSNNVIEPSTNATVAMPLQTRGTPVCTSTA